MKRLILILLLLFCVTDFSEAQVQTMRRRVSGAVELLLDNNSAGGAYSLRKLRTAYAGSAIRVRRSNDDTEQDIGFVNGVLDTSSLKTFVGANSGFVKTWYDQSGNGYDATNTTTTAQPTIIASGAVVRENGKPALSFDGGDFLTTSGTNSAWKALWDGSNSAVMAVVKISATGVRAIIASARGTSTLVGYDLFSNTTERVLSFTPNAAQTDNSNMTNNNVIVGQSLIVDILDADNATAADRTKIYVDGGSAISNNTGTGTVSTSDATHSFQIGAHGNGAYFWNGTMQEVVVWLTDQTAKLSSIRTDVNTHYTIY